MIFILFVCLLFLPYIYTGVFAFIYCYKFLFHRLQNFFPPFWHLTDMLIHKILIEIIRMKPKICLCHVSRLFANTPASIYFFFKIFFKAFNNFLVNKQKSISCLGVKILFIYYTIDMMWQGNALLNKIETTTGK